MIKKISAFVLQLCIILSCAAVIGAEEAVTSSLKLTVDKETAIVSVVDEKGNVWQTNPLDPVEDEYTNAPTLNDIRSQLLVTYYDNENKKAVIGSYVSSVRRSSFEITEKGNKIRIDYDFSRPHEKFKIPVEYKLDGNKLSVSVITDEIKEYGDVKIGEISLLPYFLSATASDNGYIVIPDGSGATIDLKTVNTGVSAYKQRVYGRDSALSYYYDETSEHSASLPLFGMNKNGSGVLAVISGNAAAASVNAECVGISSSMSRTYASFIYRVYDTVTISGSDWRYKEYTAQALNREKENFSVDYIFLSDGDYVDMANNYRKTLIDGGYLKNTMKSEDVISSSIKAYGVTEQKASFLGIPYTETVTATKFSDVEKMLEDLKGVSGNMAVFLEDFDKDSKNFGYADSTAWVGKTGGKKGFKSLSDKFSENVRFFRTTDVVHEYCDGFLWANQSKYAQMVSKDYITQNVYSNVTFEKLKSNWYALTANQLVKRSSKFFKKTAKYDKDLGIALDYIADTLYADYRESDFTARTDMINYFRKVVKNASKAGLDTAVQGANGYAIGLSQVYYDYPTTSSELIIGSNSIPFAQIVLHGYANMVSSPINLQLDSEKTFLNCIEFGMTPMYAVTAKSNKSLRRTDYKNLYATCYSKISDDLSEKFEKSNEVLSAVGTNLIKEHKNENGIGVTVYDNGVTVVVNYNDSVADFNGKTVEPGSFVLIK